MIRDEDQSRVTPDAVKLFTCTVYQCPCHDRLAAAEAARDQARRELELQHGSFAAVVAERDQARRDRTRLGLLVNEWRNSAEKAEQRATRLAALEEAARAWQTAAARMHAYDGELVPWKQAGWSEASAALINAEAELDGALDALAAPPGEGA